MKQVAVIFMMVSLYLAGQQQGGKPASKSPFPALPQFKVPPPPNQLDRFKALIGTWDTKEHWEVLEGFSPGGEGTGVETFSEGPGGQSVILDYKTLTGVFPGYTGHGIISWELDQQIYRVGFAQSVVSGISVETGKVDGDNIILTYDIVEFGKKYVVNNIYSDWKPDSFKITSYFVDTNGKAAKSVTVELTKRK